jgi:hypothetical protein
MSGLMLGGWDTPCCTERTPVDRLSLLIAIIASDYLLRLVPFNQHLAFDHQHYFRILGIIGVDKDILVNLAFVTSGIEFGLYGAFGSGLDYILRGHQCGASAT